MSEKQNLKDFSNRYPKPGPTGGGVIRKVIKSFKTEFGKLPVSSHIHIAISGGTDSLALAHAMIKYGRRVVDPSMITLLHFNHAWRGVESDRDEVFVKEYARLQKIRCLVGHRRDYKSTIDKRMSPEESARIMRYRFFESQLKDLPETVLLTAHHRDDQIETLIWRFFSGDLLKYPEGIRLRHGHLFRPLLECTKQELREFLREENLSACEDFTNSDPKYLRNAIRAELIPRIRAHFPGFEKKLSEYPKKIKNLSHSLD